MKKYMYIALKVVFSLIIFLPVASLFAMGLGYDIAPKPEYYQTPEAFTFIQVLMDSMYITIINALVFTVGLVLLWTKRTALAAVLIFPITVNVVAFHAFLDGGLFTGGAFLGNVMLAINLYFFWYHFEQYKELLRPDFSEPRA
jgi:putative oxidoreductase